MKSHLENFSEKFLENFFANFIESFIEKFLDFYAKTAIFLLKTLLNAAIFVLSFLIAFQCEY